MSKITGPLLSLGARGQIGKSMVFASWKGQPYVRQLVIPANPQTAEQTLTRTAFTEGSDLWKRFGPIAKGPWNAYAQGQTLTGRNAFVGRYVLDNRDQANLGFFEGSPGAKGGLAPASLALTPASQAMQADLTAPAAPTGWTISAAQFVCIRDGVPGSLVETISQEDEDAAAPYSVTFTGLVALTTYAVSGWLEWTKPDGTLAYGPSLTQLDDTLA